MWKKITKEQVKKVIIEAIAGFILWTTFLTPYMLFVTGLTIPQYVSWLLMEAGMVPPLAVIVVKATNYLTRKLGK